MGSITGCAEIVGNTIAPGQRMPAVRTGAPRASKVAANAIEPIPTSAYPTPAERPRNSRLDTTKLRRAFGLTLPAWQVGVDRMLTEILI